MRIPFEIFPQSPLKRYVPKPEEMENSIRIITARASESEIKMLKEAMAKASKASDIERIKEELKDLSKIDRITLLNKMLNDINIKGSDYFDNAKAHVEQMLVDEKYYSANSTNENALEHTNFLKDDIKKNTLEGYENKIPALINEWKGKKEIELCATFCNYLLKNDFFKDKKVKTAIDFGYAKYGLKITSSLNKLRKRENEGRLKEKTEKIRRMITENYFGKI